MEFCESSPGTMSLQHLILEANYSTQTGTRQKLEDLFPSKTTASQEAESLGDIFSIVAGEYKIGRPTVKRYFEGSAIGSAEAWEKEPARLSAVEEI